MKREEQIQKLIDEENGIDNYRTCDYQMGVCDGVRLANKTMIDKACEWLKRHLYDYDYVEGFEVFRNVESFTKDFRKAMEK